MSNTTPDLHNAMELLRTPDLIQRLDMVTAAKAGEILGVMRSAVCRYCREGRFPGAIQMPGGLSQWLIPREALIDYIEKNPDLKTGRKRGPNYFPRKSTYQRVTEDRPRCRTAQEVNELLGVKK